MYSKIVNNARYNLPTTIAKNAIILMIIIKAKRYFIVINVRFVELEEEIGASIVMYANVV